MTGVIITRDLTLQPGKAGRPAQMTSGAGKWAQWRDRRSLPAYISAQSVSEAIIDLLVPDSAGDTTMTEIQKGIKALPDWMPTFKDSLQALANNAGKDINLFRTSVENWYDDHMDRVASSALLARASWRRSNSSAGMMSDIKKCSRNRVRVS